MRNKYALEVPSYSYTWLERDFCRKSENNEEQFSEVGEMEQRIPKGQGLRRRKGEYERVS
jgi:hypothetical protein